MGPCVILRSYINYHKIFDKFCLIIVKYRRKFGQINMENSLAYQSGFCAAIPYVDVVPQTFTHIRTLAFIHQFVTHGTAKCQSLSPYKQIYLY